MFFCEPIKKERIAILTNSRINKETYPIFVRSKMNNAIEEKMRYYCFLPYQICNCMYIGEGVAWTGYNLTNKRILKEAIDEINSYLEDVQNLSDITKKLLCPDYYIPFDAIQFDEPYSYGLPRSYILYQPETKNGKNSRFPLIAFFNTMGEYGNIYDEHYIGEIYYAINGDLSKAIIQCRKKGRFAEIHFAVVGRSFLISKIKAQGNNHTLVEIYNCNDVLTDYKDLCLP